MRPFLPIVLVALTLAAQSQLTFSQQPIAQGEWTYKNGKPDRVTFVYGAALTDEEVDQLSSYTSLTQIVMGYAGVDSEFVEIEGDLSKLGRLKNLEEVHLCVDALKDDDLRFIAHLPKLQILEFNADNGYDEIHEIPVCTDRCANYLRAATTLRSLIIHDGQFTDKFVDKITEGLPNLEELSLNSAEFTDESLRLLAERCKKLNSLSIASNHFTAEGLKHLDKLPNLEKWFVSSPALRKRSNPKEIEKLLGTWEYVSATYEGQPKDVEKKNETITLTKDSWTLRRNGKFISSSTWEVDSTRSPKWLTVFTQGGKVNFLGRWVYKFDGEQLVLCQSSWMDERRPKEFISQKGDKQYLVVLRRKDSGKTD
ncbi:TIGR03067 domain-containing protein [Novipirellula artificiosorum]|uniref:Leucine Rich repeats (2 copies) n=1 Tax=Novipirellula artificiosorum TaxID=2528016 RepID=A0A5C6CX04_9BACT|nr:TIGR03067 domain-containing protein [Novipirellula artificiosorum]TWU27961.1 Leucine Rich repeats (2 copies) [Novipirellula artificiosorum]